MFYHQHQPNPKWILSANITQHATTKRAY